MTHRTALVLLIAIALGACANMPGSTSSARATPSADVEDLQNTFDAKLLGLTVELDRLSKRVARMERTLSRIAPLEEEPMDTAPPPVIERPAPPVVQPEPDVAATVPPVDRTAPAVSEPREDPVETEPPAPAEEPPLEKEPTPTEPKRGIQWTGVLLDARGLADRIPPGRSYLTWSVVGPDGTELFGSEDVNAEVRRRKPIFWQAVREAALGKDELPLGETPLRAVPTDAEVLEVDGVPVARLTVDAETAAKIAEFDGLKTRIAAGDVIILILAP